MKQINTDNYNLVKIMGDDKKFKLYTKVSMIILCAIGLFALFFLTNKYSNIQTDNHLLYIGLMLISLLLVIIFHEGLHGLAFKIFGYPVKYGINIKKGIAYTTSLGCVLSKKHLIVILLAPQILTVLFLTLMFIFMSSASSVLLCLLFCFSIGNFVGGCSDVGITAYVLRDSNSYIYEDKTKYINVWELKNEQN